MENNPSDHTPWKIMVVDDDRDVHDFTLGALEGFCFAGKPVQFIQAFCILKYSGTNR